MPKKWGNLKMKSTKTRSIFNVVLVIAAFVTLTLTAAFLGAATVGQQLQNITVQSPNGQPAEIPYLGEKVISIFYNDPDTADIGDPLADAIKAKNYPSEKYIGMGIANCKDAPMKPNSIIRWVLRKKSEKYKSTMLADVNHSIKDGWSLGDCNDTCVVLIIGRDRKLKFVASFKSQEEGRSYIQKVLPVLDKELGIKN